MVTFSVALVSISKRVEHSAVNRGAVGSNPTRGAKTFQVNDLESGREFGSRPNARDGKVFRFSSDFLAQSGSWQLLPIKETCCHKNVTGNAPRRREQSFYELGHHHSQLAE
jgi:hypothetical protein